MDTHVNYFFSRGTFKRPRSSPSARSSGAGDYNICTRLLYAWEILQPPRISRNVGLCVFCQWTKRNDRHFSRPVAIGLHLASTCPPSAFKNSRRSPIHSFAIFLLAVGHHMHGFSLSALQLEQNLDVGL